MSERSVELLLKLSYREADKLLRNLITSPVTGILLFWSKGKLVSDTLTVRDNDPEFTCTVAYTDAEGQPTTPDSPPSWTVDDDVVTNITSISDDGLTATFNPGSPGATQAHCNLTNADGTEVDLVGTVSVVAGEAVTGALDFQPGATPEPVA